MNRKKNKTVYYDGSCPMCTAIINKVDTSLKGEQIDLKDIQKNQLPNGVTAEEVEKEIYVTDSDGGVYKNIEALFKILEGYPRWRFLIVIGKLPIIKQILSAGYVFVAANRHFIFGRASRILWLKMILTLGVSAGLLSTIKLWLGDRFFPRIPVFESLEMISLSVESILFSILLVLLVIIAVYWKPQKAILAALFVIAIFALFDQMRWQPWIYQYFFMLGAVGLFSWNYRDIRKREDVLHTLRFIVASIYFYSGLQKVNLIFMGDVFPRMIEPIANFFPYEIQALLLTLGGIVPFLEMGIGVGLLTKRYRKYAVMLALMMFVFVILTLGPLGHNWNSVVWWWNIAMILFVFILFWKEKRYSIRDIVWVTNFPYQKLVLLLFGIMPIFSFFNSWDSYLSAALYSGNLNSAQIEISDSVREKLPDQVQGYVNDTTSGVYELDFLEWSFDELNVPTYPEARVYKSIAKYLCHYTDVDSGVVLTVNGKSTMVNAGPVESYNCASL